MNPLENWLDKIITIRNELADLEEEISEYAKEENLKKELWELQYDVGEADNALCQVSCDINDIYKKMAR